MIWPSRIWTFTTSLTLSTALFLDNNNYTWPLGVAKYTLFLHRSKCLTTHFLRFCFKVVFSMKTSLANSSNIVILTKFFYLPYCLEISNSTYLPLNISLLNPIRFLYFSSKIMLINTLHNLTSIHNYIENKYPYGKQAI